MEDGFGVCGGSASTEVSLARHTSVYSAIGSPAVPSLFLYRVSM